MLMQPQAEDQTARRIRRTSHRIHIPALNITSFLDMSFCLLTFLILSASFVGPEGVISANVPDLRGMNPNGVETSIPKLPIVIKVSPVGAADCRMSIAGLGEAPRSPKELTAILTRIQNNPDKGRNGVYAPDNPVVIQPEADVRWQHVVNAFNAAVKAQYTSIDFQPSRND